MRGFGKSAVPSGINYTHAEDLKSLLDNLGINKAHILGHSFGGRVSIAFAVLYPEMTLSMIGADPALEGFYPDDPDSQEIFDWITKVWNTGSKSGINAAKELWIQFSPLELAMKNPEVSRSFKLMLEDYSGWHWINEDTYQPLDPPAVEQLEKIQAPTLLLIGELNPSLFHAAGDIMIEKIPNCERQYISGVAHMLNMEDPGQFNSKLLEFLQKVKNS